MKYTKDISAHINKERYDINDLIEICEYLRSEDGCPWDKVQTHSSIRPNLIEETYEVVESIDKEDPKLMREELGDLLYQIMFHSSLEAEKKTFDFGDVVNDICVKLIFRHPHVFGDLKAGDADEALANWEMAKKAEKKDRKTLYDSLTAVPKEMPSLMRAKKVAGKIHKRDDLKEISERFEIPVSNNSQDNDEEFIGRLLYGAAAYAADRDLDPETLLSKYTDRVIDNCRSEDGENS